MIIAFSIRGDSGRSWVGSSTRAGVVLVGWVEGGVGCSWWWVEVGGVNSVNWTRGVWAGTGWDGNVSVVWVCC